MGESQGSSRRSDGKYPVKPPHPEDDSQTIDTYQWRSQEHLNIVSNNRQYLQVSPAECEPARQKYIASQKPTALPTELSGRPIINMTVYKLSEEKLSFLVFPPNIDCGNNIQ